MNESCVSSTLSSSPVVKSASKTSGIFTHYPTGGWRFRQWASPHVVAGVTDRQVTISQVLPEGCQQVDAQQVHGGSVAAVERGEGASRRIAGCDALVTSRPGVALFIRSADCLPIFFVDPQRLVVGVAHAGWRGLAQRLPMRMVGAFSRYYRTRPFDLRVAIGPAIRACCYEVGEEFRHTFGTFVRSHAGGWRCDLIGMAVDQLRRSGVLASHVMDTQRCTSCERSTWFSLRREGQATGRLVSYIMIHEPVHASDVRVSLKAHDAHTSRGGTEGAADLPLLLPHHHRLLCRQAREPLPCVRRIGISPSPVRGSHLCDPHGPDRDAVCQARGSPAETSTGDVVVRGGDWDLSGVLEAAGVADSLGGWCVVRVGGHLLRLGGDLVLVGGE